MLRKRKGFTLIEVLIVVLIIAVLAAVVIPRLLGQIHKAKEAEAVQSLGAIRSAELTLQGMAGQFAAAADEAGIKSVLGLIVGGGAYRYKITEASAENFLAIAIPLDLLDNWLQEIVIDKDGFVGYSPGGGGGLSGGESGGSSSGGSSGSGSGSGSTGSSGSGGARYSSGGGYVIPGGSTPGTPADAVAPSFDGYAADIQTALDTLTLSTFALSSSGTETGEHLSSWLQEKEISVAFGETSSGVGGYCAWDGTRSLPYIVISSQYQENKYVCAMFLAHEAAHASWYMDSYAQHGGEPYQYGVPTPEFGDWRTNGVYDTSGHEGYGSDTIDNEYNAFVTGSQVWKDLKSQYDVGMVSGYGPGADDQANNFVNEDGTLKPESAAKDVIRAWGLYAGLPEY